jgi:hypothetical protein
MQPIRNARERPSPEGLAVGSENPPEKSAILRPTPPDYGKSKVIIKGLR